MTLQQELDGLYREALYLINGEEKMEMEKKRKKREHDGLIGKIGKTITVSVSPC